MTQPMHAPEQQRPGRPPRTLLLDDLVEDLVWPELLRAGPLSLRPSRVGLGAMGVLLLALLWAGGVALDPRLRDVAAQLGVNLASLASAGFQPRLIAEELYQITLAWPRVLITGAPVAGPIVVLLSVVVVALAGGAISRSAACDYALNHAISWPQALGFAIARWRALLSAMLIPPLLLWLIALAIALAGALFNLPGLNLLGGTLWGLALLAGFLASVIVVAYLAGAPLLIPAVACEDADGADAIQRAYAFVIARPVRLVIYALILIVQGVLVVGILATLLWLGVTIVSRVGTAFAPSAQELMPTITPQARDGLTGLERLTRSALGLWLLVPLLIALGAAFSYLATASTLLYLALRRVCDGQDTREIWNDQLIPSTMAPVALASPIEVARANAARSEGVSEDGPADEN